MGGLFRVVGDHIKKYEFVDENKYKTEVVMDKQTFVEAYKRWILGEQEQKDHE